MSGIPRSLGAGLFVTGLAVCASAQSQDQAVGQERRIALVIGNGDYDPGHLRNPVNNARAIAQVLCRAGFEVVAKENADRVAMYEAIDTFGNRLKETKGVGLFYFSGRGLTVRGRYFLVPTRAPTTTEQMVEAEAIDVDQVLGRMSAAQTRVNIVILDASRNNPYGSRIRSGSRSPLQSDGPPASLIAFATGPGQIAEDGAGQNSPYTAALVKHIATPGLQIENVLRRVRTEVAKETGGRQLTWESSSLTEDFFFFPAGASASPPPAGCPR